MFHRLKLSINSPGFFFLQPSQWSTTSLPFIIPLHLEMFKCSRSGRKCTHAESTNSSVGWAPVCHCQSSQTLPNGGGSCQCFAGCLSASPIGADSFPVSKQKGSRKEERGEPSEEPCPTGTNQLEIPMLGFAHHTLGVAFSI